MVSIVLAFDLDAGPMAAAAKPVSAAFVLADAGICTFLNPHQMRCR
jgi:hypothetical protein